MTLKSAALLALIGMILVTAVLVWDFVFDLLGVLRGLIPAVGLFSALVFAFGALTLTVFLFVFQQRTP